MQDAQVKGLSVDAQFLHAYNAALALASAALYAAGFKPHKQQSHHLRVIESLRFTVAADDSLVDQFDTFRAKRHKGVYDIAGGISKTEAHAMFEIADKLSAVVPKWLKDHHPQLC